MTWAAASKAFGADRLAAGINLPAEFAKTPFDAAFKAVDEAVAKKQNHETKQIKSLFHEEEGRIDMKATVAFTEKARAPLAADTLKARVSVAHTLVITAAQ